MFILKIKFEVFERLQIQFLGKVGKGIRNMGVLCNFYRNFFIILNIYIYNNTFKILIIIIIIIIIIITIIICTLIVI
jgi:hypothetical protein